MQKNILILATLVFSFDMLSTEPNYAEEVDEYEEILLLQESAFDGLKLAQEKLFAYFLEHPDFWQNFCLVNRRRYRKSELGTDFEIYLRENKEQRDIQFFYNFSRSLNMLNSLMQKRNREIQRDSFDILSEEQEFISYWDSLEELIAKKHRKNKLAKKDVDAVIEDIETLKNLLLRGAEKKIFSELNIEEKQIIINTKKIIESWNEDMKKIDELVKNMKLCSL